MHPIALPAGITWKGLLAVGLGAKFVIAGAAYVLWATSAVSGAHRRVEFLDHTNEVLKNMLLAGVGPEQEDLKILNENLETLRRAIPTGVRSGEEWVALGHVMKYLTYAHSQSTAEAFTDLSGRAYTSSMDWLLSAFVPQTPPTDEDIDRRHM